MKKKKAAKVLSPNERALRERVRLRDHARSVAIGIRRTWDWLDRAIEAGEGSDAERFCFCMEQVKDSWFMAGNLLNFGSPAMMRLIADALEGKSLLSKKDEEKLEAYTKAMREGKRFAERRTSWSPFPSEVADASSDIATSKWADNHVKWKKPNKEAASRRLKAMGRPLSEEPGTPRKRP